MILLFIFLVVGLIASINVLHQVKKSSSKYAYADINYNRYNTIGVLLTSIYVCGILTLIIELIK